MKALVTAVLLIVLALTARIVKQYEQGVLFRLGWIIGVRPAARASRPRTSLPCLLIHVNRRNVSSMASRPGETGALKVLLHR